MTFEAIESTFPRGEFVVVSANLDSGDWLYGFIGDMGRVAEKCWIYIRLKKSPLGLIDPKAGDPLKLIKPRLYVRPGDESGVADFFVAGRPTFVDKHGITIEVSLTAR